MEPRFLNTAYSLATLCHLSYWWCFCHACSDIVTNPEHMLPLSHIPGPLPYILQGREMLMDLLLGITFLSVAVDDPSFAHERSESGFPAPTYLAFLNDSGNCLSPHPAFVS